MLKEGTHDHAHACSRKVHMTMHMHAQGRNLACCQGPCALCCMYKCSERLAALLERFLGVLCLDSALHSSHARNIVQLQSSWTALTGTRITHSSASKTTLSTLKRYAVCCCCRYIKEYTQHTESILCIMYTIWVSHSECLSGKTVTVKQLQN
jgi:hypothetical protein